MFAHMQFTSMVTSSRTLHDTVFEADMKLLLILDSRGWLSEGAGCKGLDILGQQSVHVWLLVTALSQCCYEAVIRLLVV